MVKLSVSSLGGLVGVAVGFADLVSEYRDTIKGFGSTSFERALAILPAHFRAAHAEKQKRALAHDFAYDQQASADASRIRRIYRHPRPSPPVSFKTQ